MPGRATRSADGLLEKDQAPKRRPGARLLQGRRPLALRFGVLRGGESGLAAAAEWGDGVDRGQKLYYRHFKRPQLSESTEDNPERAETLEDPAQKQLRQNIRLRVRQVIQEELPREQERVRLLHVARELLPAEV